MGVPNSVIDLVERFNRNSDAYKRGSYNETQVRREFIDPFFDALGWDVSNKSGFAEAYKDVIHEYSQKTDYTTEAPDYLFRIGGTRKFFVEAKKPSIKLAEDIFPAYQLRRYAWTAKLPLSILTDFEELAVYDCRIKPDKNDKASTARINLYTYTDYPEKWEEIYSVFSKDAVLKGSFDKFAESNKGKRGTAEVDDSFLSEIERWREQLAKNIALRNPNLTNRELNYAVQKNIDRIIFLRICEDRGIEEYGQLLALNNGANVYGRLLQIFTRADEKYNSGLFHFENEKHIAESPDEITPKISIDDNTLKDIIKTLYFPDCPYEFSVLPADILGHVYEQFLGKVIRLTPAHQAKIEEKPEVKKAGGVYYTPTYIVDYIVKNTVGVKLNGKTPKDVNKLTILDPACGSGSFLLGAYQYLLDWHLDYYYKSLVETNKYAALKNTPLYQSANGEWKLTTAERKRILLNNIYGVDIDTQAVEVTKLSLLLKVLEGETDQTISAQFKMFRERALPDLSNNIKCGNSLIGPDFYEQQSLLFADDEERLRVNVFDWNEEFKDIMKSGGFDVVIGNPPYVDIKGMEKVDVDYIFNSYESSNNRINLFATFIERAFQITRKENFRFSMIIPSAILTQDSYKTLRKIILDNYNISNIVRLPNESFGSSAGEVKVDTVIVVFTEYNKKERNVEVLVYEGYKRINLIDKINCKIVHTFNSSSWLLHNDYTWSINRSVDTNELITKCENLSKPLDYYADFSLGITPYDKYRGHSPQQIKNKVFHSDHKKDDTYKKLLAGNDVKRYYVKWNGISWISYGTWLGAPREKKYFTNKRIIVKQIIDWTDKRIWASLLEEEIYNTQNAFTLLSKGEVELELLLGILNSKLMSYYHRKKYLEEYKMRFQKILIKDCKQFPIKISSDDKISKLVKKILDFSIKALHVQTPHEQQTLQRQINTLDKEIDKLVYELYGLTEEEIKIVEGNG
jgi:type I restriction-modification system DNA methylase subunit